MSLINPDEFRIKTIECMSCETSVEYPNDAERRAFNMHHIHGNPMLQAWFDNNDAGESPTFPTDPGVRGGELCADCDKPAVIRQDAGHASYGFCAEHRQ
jgi:endogenous inhibitor of DNA gyrase (YacG/DUF329 family)